MNSIENPCDCRMSFAAPQHRSKAIPNPTKPGRENIAPTTLAVKGFNVQG
jgi:hypothetical protein